MEEIPESPTDINDLEIEDVDVWDLGPNPQPEAQPDPLVQQAESLQAELIKNFPAYTKGLVTKRKAESAKTRYLKQAEITSSTTRPVETQLNVEDLVGTWQFVLPPDNIDFKLFEKNIFEQDHIAGEILSRIASAVTSAGVESARYKLVAQGEDAPGDKEEIAGLAAWRDKLFKYREFKEAISISAAIYGATGNLYWEVVREKYMTSSDASAKPVELDYFITSTMRIMHHHRGFVQSANGKFIYYNNYEPDEQARKDGIKLWEDYWSQKGIDPYSDKFKSTSWATSLSATMPEGAINPNLTEVIHRADISLSSKYYGYPRDARIQKLHALLQFSLDWNIMVQRNGSPPFALVIYGDPSDQEKKALQDDLRAYRGVQGAGKVPVLRAKPAPAAIAGGTAPKTGIERVVLASENSEGKFIELIRMLVDHMAMHYRYPIDMLLTDNSNRSTALSADTWLQQKVVDAHHEMFEDMLSKLSRDAGFSERYISFNSLDIDDKYALAKMAWGYMDRGVFTPNDVLNNFLNMPPRADAGGDMHRRLSTLKPDDALLAPEPTQKPAPDLGAQLPVTQGQTPQQEKDAAAKKMNEELQKLFSENWNGQRTGP